MSRCVPTWTIAFQAATVLPATSPTYSDRTIENLMPPAMDSPLRADFSHMAGIIRTANIRVEP